MKGKLKNIVLIVLIISLHACSQKTHVSQSADTNEKAGFIKATVIKYDLDGCSWMLQLADKRKLEPVNMKEEFKKENLNVWIKYQTYNGNSICMAGEMITITDIQLRK
jgi:hypothetical protein